MGRSELEFDIDVVTEPQKRAPAAWRRNACQIVVGLCGAGILAGAMPVLSEPLYGDDDDDIVFPQHRAHHVTQSAPFTLNTSTPTAFDEEPVPLADPAAPHVSERVRRERARTLTEQSGFLHALSRVGASGPEVREKQAAAVHVSQGDGVERAFDPGDVAFALSERAPAFRACYERALKKNARLAGDFKLSFTVSAKGNVDKARVQPRDGDGLGHCLQSVVKRMRFNAPAAAIDVSRKLTFRAPS